MPGHSRAHTDRELAKTGRGNQRTRLWKNDLRVSVRHSERSIAYTLPPSSFELTVTTTVPMVIKEMTSEKTCIDCSCGAWA